MVRGLAFEVVDGKVGVGSVLGARLLDDLFYFGYAVENDVAVVVRGELVDHACHGVDVAREWHG